MRNHVVVALAVALIFFANPALAQDSQNDAEEENVGVGGRFKQVGEALMGSFGEFRLDKDVLLLIPTVVGAIALDRTGIDERVSDYMSRRGFPTSSFGRQWGSWATQFALTGGLMIFGETTDSNALADFGEEAFAAVLETELLFQVVKVSAGRRRPDGSNRRAMPSGHVGKTTALAVVTWKHFGWKAGLPTTVAAAVTAASRLDHQKHHVSDIVVGVVGAFVITNMVDRFYDTRDRVGLFVEPQPVMMGNLILGHKTAAGIRLSW